MIIGSEANPCKQQPSSIVIQIGNTICVILSQQGDIYFIFARMLLQTRNVSELTYNTSSL